MIDTSKIAGYETMTPEEKVLALESFDVPNNEDEVVRLRNALNKATSEAADFKKQVRGMQSEEERRNAEREENDRAIREELETLRSEKTIAQYKASYLALGYDDELATATAIALNNGDTKTVFENQQVFNERKKAEFTASLLEKQPTVTVGEPPKAQPMTRQQIMAIKNTAERQKAIAENLDVFRN